MMASGAIVSRSLTGLAGLRECGGRGRARNDCPEDERLVSRGGVDLQLDRFPVGRVSHLNFTDDEIERRADAPGARDRPAVGRARQRDFFAADSFAAKENDEDDEGAVDSRLLSGEDHRRSRHGTRCRRENGPAGRAGGGRTGAGV